jgi:nucleoside-diphosphate-sugar epimerase
MCQAALKNSCEKIVHVSTSEVYGTAQYVPIDENHPLQPQSPYSASKISADALAKSYHLSFGLPLTIARPFNTYGPRQSARAVIPSIIGQLSQNKEFLDMGNLTPTRDFNFVKDTCHGFMEIASSEKTIGETVNIATETEISILDLVKLIKELLQSDTEIRIKDERLRPEKSEVYRLLGSNKKIKSLTDFTPQYSLEKGLLETIDWFQNPENQKKYKFNIYNR